MRKSGKRLVFLAGAMALLVVPAAASGAPLPPYAAPEAHTHGPDPKALDRRGQTGNATYEVDTHASWSSGDYDGQALTSEAPDLTALPTAHAVYVYPSDAPNRFTQFAAMFQADARQTVGLLYGRAVRFDERVGADGTARYLDITVVRSKYPTKRLSGSRQYQLVRDELAADARFRNPNKKYVVWLDAGSQYCGQAQIYQDTVRSPQNQNEQRMTALVYRPYTASDPQTGGFCRGRTLLHELGHTMGALQTVAPNIYLSSGPHCDDSAEDVMCYRPAGTPDTGGPVFDYNSDDYWDPAATGTGSGAKLGWWTVNLSRFICPRTGCQDASTPDY